MENRTGYRKTDLEISEAYAEITEYEYAYIYLISKVILQRVKQLPEIDWDECIEARFFSKEKELHIFEGDDGKQAVRIEDDGEGEINIRTYELATKYDKVGKILKVQEYLDYDKDGQIYVALTRLKGIA